MDSTLYMEEMNGKKILTGGKEPSNQLLYQLKRCMKKADSVDIIVSFLMESGVKLLLKDLKDALDRGVHIRILTGNYLGITQPSALYLLKHALKNKVEIRFFSDPSISFHPKAYLFHYKDFDEVFIGSSNLSKSALKGGIEWNYGITSDTDEKSCQIFQERFLDLYENHSIVVDDLVLKNYAKNWHRPQVAKDLELFNREQLEETETDQKVVPLFEPRGVQIEAICALENSREEGAKRGLVHAATGVGKTYLAAFDSKSFKRVLFVAHREEILNQAAVSFRNVRGNDDYGFFHGDEKTTDKSVIFASVSTLGRKEYLTEKYFAPDYFDYIVIDEFHHAVTGQYQNIVDYFKPQFLLGLTATPERMDGRNIYALCDYNVPYEIDLKQAINRGILVPFHYYGIFDETDYSDVRMIRGKFEEKSLTDTYLKSRKRNDLIMKYYKKYGSRRALGFCCSRRHAQAMAEYFTTNGVPAVAVYTQSEGDPYTENRKEAIQKLKNGEIRVVFSVDMFNEGVDITNVDMVLFLRPTESPVVFLQQLGRGLRKAPGKEYLNVLDFIGNYESAGKVRFFLSGNKENVLEGGNQPVKPSYPDECLIDFDMGVIDLFEKLDRKNMRLDNLIQEEYSRVKAELGHRPTRIELFTYMDDAICEKMLQTSKSNVFRDYLSFLKKQDDLTEDEHALMHTIAADFLKEIELTSMSKVYKMPVLLAFYNNGDIRMEVSEEELLKTWKEFFSENRNWRDLKTKITYEQYLKISDKTHLSNILKNPVHFLIKSGKGFFVQKDHCPIGLSEQLWPEIHKPAFAEQLRDIVGYRAMNYYSRRYRKEEEN